MKKVYRIAFSIGLLMLLAVLARAEVETEIPDFYGKNELATKRALRLNGIERTQNPAIMTKTTETLLRGPLTVTVRVADAKTSQPISNYVVHAFYVARGRRLVAMEHHDNVSGVKWAYRMDHELPIGRLESKVVAATDGHCVYDNMPAGRYWFQVLADGYVPKQESVGVLPGKSEIVIAVEPTAGFALRLVDGTTSQPLAGILVRLEYPLKHESQHAKLEHYEGRTDIQGNMFIMGLPNDEYTVSFPELTEQLHEVPGKLMRLGYPNAGVYRTMVGDHFFRTMEDYFAKPHYCPPSPVAKITSGSLDLGTLALARVPTAEIEIKNTTGKPLPFFPFDLVFGDQPFHYATDRDGKARVPLIGFTPGTTVYLCAPGRLSPRYQIGALKPDPTKPEHPNVLASQPQPGTIFPLLLTYRPTEFDVDLRLAFRDKTTGKPIGQASGAITNDMESVMRGHFAGAMSGDEGNARLFETSGTQAVIPHYTLTSNLVRLEKEVAEKDSKDPNSRKDDYEHKQLRLMTYVRAAGYTPQMFEIQLSDVRAGRAQTFDLEPAANVRGRVMVAPGMPFTSDTLKNILVKQGQWNEKSQKSLAMAFGGGGRPPLVRFENRVVDGELKMGATNFTHWIMVPIKPDGSFVTGELRATIHWEMSIQTEFWPPVNRRELEIKPGENDLGEIFVGKGGGSLNFKLTDERGQSIDGARLDFPLENGSYRYTLGDKLFTDSQGQTSIALNFLESGPRQVIHLSPPWGFNKDPRRDRDAYSSIIYDLQLNLDKAADTDLKTSITRGHTLKVQLNPSATGQRLALHYADTKNWPVESYSKQRTRPYFAVRGFALESLGSPSDDFRYHQYREIAGGLSLTSGTQELVIKDVPPGRFALRIDGGFYTPLVGQKSPTEARGGVPIAYTELEMPVNDHAVTTDLNPTEVVLELDGVTSATVAQGKVGLLVLMDREQPLSTVLGSEFRRQFAMMPGLAGKDRESIQTPLVGYVEGFVYTDEAGYKYRPARFMAVPPGAYVVSVYKDFTTMMGPASKPCWEQRIEVKPGSGPIRLRMPFPKSI